MVDGKKMDHEGIEMIYRMSAFSWIDETLFAKNHLVFAIV